MTKRKDPNRPRPMTREEMLDEVEWLLDGGVHILVITEQVGRKLATIRDAARDLGRTRVLDAAALDLAA